MEATRSRIYLGSKGSWSIAQVVPSRVRGVEWNLLAEDQMDLWLSVEPGHPHPALMIRLGWSSGRTSCTGLMILAGGGRGDITARRLRQIPLTKVMAVFGTLLDQVPAGQLEALGLGTGVKATGIRPGPIGWPHEHYDKVARAYRQAATASPSSPIKRLSEDWPTPEGKPTPEPTIRRWVQESRRLGLLDDFPARPGRPRTPGPDTKSLSRQRRRRAGARREMRTQKATDESKRR